MTEQIEGAPSAQHGPIPEDECCIFCCDDITADNYAEYLPYPDEAVKEGEDGKKATSSSGWLRCIYCSDCLEDQMLKKQWAMWVERVKTTDCKAEQRRLLTVGPPINLKDDKGIPCPNNGEVYKLWYSKDNTEKVAKLEGSLVGEVRSDDHVFRKFLLSVMLVDNRSG